MASSVSWLDFSEDDQQRVRELLRAFSDKGTVDDLGFGTIRDAISNQLFPGTSVIQTRARYFLFIPWIYARAERRFASKLVAKADDMERRLIEALLRGSEGSGVIGREARMNLKTLPSAIYWSGLAKYGIFRAPGRTRRQYGQLVARGIRPPDQEGEIVERTASFWAELPEPPATFFDFDEATFTLTGDEAGWLCERFMSTETALTGPNLLSQFARSLQRGDASALQGDYVWEETLPPSTPSSVRELVEHSRQFSFLAIGASYLYNLMLTELIDEQSAEPRDWQYDYPELLSIWGDDIATHQTRAWCADLDPFWTCISRTGINIDGSTQRFVNEWASLVANTKPDELRTSKPARDLIQRRELGHKRSEARFHNRKRLLAYPGNAGTTQFGYRWDLVRALLADISSGLPVEAERALA